MAEAYGRAKREGEGEVKYKKSKLCSVEGGGERTPQRGRRHVQLIKTKRNENETRTRLRHSYR